jgi:signal transduction histidine kinase
MKTRASILAIKQVEEMTSKFLWVINVRWVMLIVLGTGLLVFSHWFQNISRFRVLLELVLAEFLLNFVYFFVSEVQFENHFPVIRITLFTILLDSVFIGYYLLFAGVLGWFSGLIFAVPVIIGGMVFPLWINFLNTFLISLIYYAYLQLGLRIGLISRGLVFQQLSSIVFFFLINYFVGYLSEQMRNREHLLWQAQADIIEKNNQIYQTQQEIIRTERLATVTEVAIGLDEEINAPVTVILGILYYLNHHISHREELAEEETQEVRELLKLIIDQVKKIRETMKNLGWFEEKKLEGLSEAISQ